MPRPVNHRDRPLFPRAARLLLPAIAVVILFPLSDVSAQFEGRVYAITGARLVTGTGQVVESGTIVLRGGPDGIVNGVYQAFVPRLGGFGPQQIVGWLSGEPGVDIEGVPTLGQDVLGVNVVPEDLPAAVVE